VLRAPAPAAEVVACAEHRALARTVAARSAVLLRNEPVEGKQVLPLDPDAVPSIAVLGRLADTVNLGDRGSSDVWALDCVTVLAGLRAVAPDLDIGYDAGDDPARGAAVAARADVAVVVAGYTADDEGEYIGDSSPELVSLFPPADEPADVARFHAEIAELPPTITPDRVERAAPGFARGGDRASLRLHACDVDLICAVAEANPRTVVVIQGGSAVLTGEWHDRVPAIVQAWYGGSEAGTGLGDILFGTENPSARLPISVPVDESHLPPFDRDARHTVYDGWHGWWHLRREGHTPTFPFGFGLSYTSFELGPVVIALAGDEIAVDGSVANTGTMDGADVVQVYAELPDPDTPMRLAGFARVAVGAGEVTPFTIRIPLERLTRRDTDEHAWTRPSGAHTFVVGRYAGDPAALSRTLDL
jgi:beta-glucosidase